MNHTNWDDTMLRVWQDKCLAIAAWLYPSTEFMGHPASDGWVLAEQARSRLAWRDEQDRWIGR